MARTPESRPAAPSAAPEREPRVPSKFETLFCEIPFPDDVELSPSHLLWFRIENKALWPSGDCDHLAVYFFDDDEEICEAFVIGGIHDRQSVVLTYAQFEGLVHAPRNSDPVPDATPFDPATTTEGDLLAIPFGEEDRVPFQSADAQEEGPVDVDESGVSEQEKGELRAKMEEAFQRLEALGVQVDRGSLLPEANFARGERQPYLISMSIHNYAKDSLVIRIRGSIKKTTIDGAVTWFHEKGIIGYLDVHIDTDRLYDYDNPGIILASDEDAGIGSNASLHISLSELENLINKKQAPEDNAYATYEFIGFGESGLPIPQSPLTVDASVDVKSQPAEQLPETETSEPSEPPAEFIKKLEEIRATFDVPLVREYYNNLSSEELQQVARLAWWIVSDIGKKWLIYGKPNGFRHPGHGGMIEHGVGVVPIEKRDNAFVENYRRIMANFFQKHSAEMVMSEPNDEYRQQMDIWLGPPLREDVSDKQSQAYRLFHLSTTNPGGDATFYDNRPTGYEHSFFLRWNSPFFEWLRETEDLRPLTFAIREAAVYLDPDTANQRTKKPFVTHNWVAGGFELNGKATLTDSGNQTDGSEGFAAVHAIDYEQKADAADAVGITTRTLTASFPNYQEFARVLATNTRFKRTPPPQNWLSNKGTMRWIKPMTESHHAGDEDYFSVDLKTGKTQ